MSGGSGDGDGGAVFTALESLQEVCVVSRRTRGRDEGGERTCNMSTLMILLKYRK